MNKIKLGIVITARDFFPPRDLAAQNADRIRARLAEIFAAMPHVECIYADHLLEDGLVTGIAESNQVADYFKDQRVDALFVPHANFGQEEAIGIIANALRVPTLVWGPRDGSPDDSVPLRMTDTQCGLFATTRLLLRYGLPYTYLRNCWLDSDELVEGIDKFIRVASVVKAFRGMRILQLSTRPRQFLSVKINEGELLERFGIHVVPIESTEIVATVKSFQEEKTAARQLLADMAAQGINTDQMNDESMFNIACLILGIKKLAETYHCTAAASECWELVYEHFNIGACFALGYLSQMGLPTACENDIHGAISSILAQAAALYETPSFLADITVRHPQNENAELLWHCGPFPPVLAKNTPAVKDCKGSYQLKDGTLTLVRFEADHQDYVLLAEECNTTDGPETTGNYVWIETQDWGKWEDKLMYGPYIHHIAGVYGSYKDVFHEACKYINVTHDYVF